ncbi:unnamed protein product, partial [Rotaria magnacalcarata]
KDKVELISANGQQVKADASLVALGNILGLGDHGFIDADLDTLLDILRAGADRIRPTVDHADTVPTAGVLGHRAALFLNLLADAADAVNSHIVASGLRAFASADANSLPFFAGLLVAYMGPAIDHLSGSIDALNFHVHGHNAINAIKRLAGGADASADLANALDGLVDIVLRDVDDTIDPKADFTRNGEYIT